MVQFDAASKAVLDAAEWVAIATAGPDGPHIAATWGEYLRKLGIGEDRLLIPAGGYEKVEENLKHDKRMELLFAARQNAGGEIGFGCSLKGWGEVVASGEAADAVKAQFPWARAALVFHIETVKVQR